VPNRRAVPVQAPETFKKLGESKRIILALCIVAIIIAALLAGIYWARYYSTSEGTTTADAQWVDQFVAVINQQRVENGSTPLQLAGNLSQFAAIRFQNASSHYSYDNYGFTNDSIKVFGASHGLVTEDIFYPASAPPSVAASFFQKYYPDKWDVFLNDGKSHYGYFAGYAPSYYMTNGCDLLEYPPNVNITQYLQTLGCTFTLKNTQWLVFELST
jgi:hypothetical protein